MVMYLVEAIRFRDEQVMVMYLVEASRKDQVPAT